MKPSLVIMAAGMGSRYGGLKQIDPVGPNKEIIIDYSLFDAHRAGFEKVVFIIRKDIEDVFREVVGDKLAGKFEVHYVIQALDKAVGGYEYPADRVKPWGTGHAILMADEVVNEPFMVINADDYYGIEGYKLMFDHLSSVDPSSSDYSLAGYTLRNTLSDHGTVSRGICQVDDAKNLEHVVEHLKIERKGEGGLSHQPEGDVEMTGDEYTSMNMFGFTPTLFDELKTGFAAFLREQGQEMKSEYLIPNIVGQMIKDGKAKVKVIPSPSAWFGVTYPEDKPKCVEALQKLHDDRLYPEKLWG